MSLRQRGEEIAVRFLLNGQPVGGSWLKTQDLEVTPQTDIKETDFLGEPATDYDTQHHGFGLTWTLHNLDPQLVQYLDDYVQLDADHKATQDLRVQVLYKYRDGNQPARVVTYFKGAVKVASEGFRSRKDYVETKFEARYSSRRSQTV